MNKKSIPYIIGIPNMAVGLLWAMNLVLIPMLVGTITDSNSKLGILISMGSFTGIFVQYFAGILSDRSKFKMGKRKPFMLIGGLASAIFMCLMPFSKTYTLIFLCAFLFYFSLNFFQGPYYSLIPEVVDSSKLGLANGFSKIISVLGSAVVFIAGPILWKSSHKAPFFLVGALGLLTVIITIVLIKEDPDKFELKPSKMSFDFMKFDSVTKLYFSVFFIFFGYGCITPFFTKYCVEFLKFNETTASTGLLMITLSGAIFAYPIGLIADKIEKRKVLLFGALLFSLCLLIGAFVRSSLGLYIVLAAIGIGFISIQITIYTIIAEIVPPLRLGEFMGLLNLFISLSQCIATNFMGFLLDKFGFQTYFPIASGTMFIAVIILFFSRFKKYNSSMETEN
jgi:MFS family permease